MTRLCDDDYNPYAKRGFEGQTVFKSRRGQACCYGLLAALASATAQTPAELALNAPWQATAQVMAQSAAITGETQPGAVVWLLVRGMPALQTSAGIDGRFSFAAPALAEGDNAIVVAAQIGGLLLRCERIVTLDSTPPKLVVDQPAARPMVLAARELSVLGTTEPRLVVRASCGEVATAAVSGPDGRFRLDLHEALQPGENQVVLRTADQAGNPAELTLTVLLDNDPPQLTLAPPYDADGAVVGQAAPLLGQTEPGAHLRVRLNGRELLDTLVEGDGGFILGQLPLSDGPNELALTVVDQVGNALTLSRRLVLDQTAPMVRLQAPLDAGEYCTTVALLGVRGEAEPGCRLRLTVDGRDLEQAEVGQQGRFAVAPFELAEGSHDLLATVTDAAGNSAAAACRVVLDRTPPALQLTAPGPVEYVESARVELAGRTEPETKVELSGNGAEAAGRADGNGLFRLQGLPVKDGVNTYELTLTDALGNHQSVPVVIVGRISDPWLNVVSPQVGWQSSNTLKIVAEHEAGATLQVRLNGKAVGGGETRPVYGAFGTPRELTVIELERVAAGPHRLELSATSPSGKRRSVDQRDLHVAGAPSTIGLSLTPSTIWPGQQSVLEIEVRDRWGQPVANGTPVVIRAPSGIWIGDTEPLDRGVVLATTDGDCLARVSDPEQRAKTGTILVGALWLTESTTLVVLPPRTGHAPR